MTVQPLPPFSGNYFRLWCPQWATGVSDVFNTTDQQGAASDNEINIWQYQQLGYPSQNTTNRSASISAMKAVNPTGVNAVYVNGTYAPAGQKPANLTVPMGQYSSGSTYASVTAEENILGFHQLPTFYFGRMDTTVPIAYNDGRILIAQIAPKIGGTTEKWSAIAAGNYDANIINYLNSVAALTLNTVYLSFTDESDGTAAQNNDIAAGGTGSHADYAAAYNHIAALADVHCPNVLHYQSYTSSSHLGTWAPCSRTQVLAFDPHNYSGGANLDFSVMLSNVAADMATNGFSSLPWVINTGVAEEAIGGATKATWFTNMFAALATAKATFPNLLFGTYWNVDGTVNGNPAHESIDSGGTNPGALAAFKTGLTTNTAGQATFFQKTAYHPTADRTYPYLTDNGNTWLMDPRSPEWTYKSTGTARSVADESNNRRVTQFASPPADGYMIDNLGTAIIDSGYNFKDTGTGAGSGGAYSAQHIEAHLPWTDATEENRWMQLTSHIAMTVNGLYGRDTGVPVALYVNGASEGSKWWATVGATSKLASVGQLVMFESWVRTARAGLGVYKSESDWVLDCNAMLDLQLTRGKGALMFCKIWAGSPHAGHISAGSPLVSSANDDNELSTVVIPHRLCAASFMLCTDGHSFFHFRHDSVGGNERIPKDRWYDSINALGAPTESWSAGIGGNGTTGGIVNAKQAGAAANLYRRNFAHGVVLVNPSGATTNNTFTLPAGTFKDVDGTTYSGTVSVPNTVYARMLVKQ